MPRYWGLDLHAQYVHVCEWRPETQKEKHSRFPNTPDGWARFLQRLSPDDRVALEVTGNAFEVYDWLSPHVAQVLLANPVELRRLGSGRHTDRVDAARLAKMLAMGTLPTVWVPPQPVRELRRLLRYRERLLNVATRWRNPIRAVLRRYGEQPPRGVDLGAFLTPERLGAFASGDRAIVVSALRQLQCTQEECTAIEAEIAEHLARTPEAQVLLTMTGVGPITAAAIWAALGDPRRFRTPKQVARYAGLDPSVYQSGETYFHGKISKNGNPLLRTYLIEAAHILARFDNGPLGQFYHRKRRQLGHKRAVVALARKLLIVAWRMLLTGESYRYQRPKTVQNKMSQLRGLRRHQRNWEDVMVTVLAKPQERARQSRMKGYRTEVPA